MLENLAINQWTIYPNLFSGANISMINWWAKGLPMRKANIVKGNIDYRGDEIHWLEHNDPVENLIQYKLEQLKTHLNSRFYLGLKSVEAHLAHYPVGKGYGKHLDATKDNNERVVSLVTYLNEDWSEHDEGQLRLYTNDGIIDIEPKAGTTVLFVSDEVEHEVLTTNTDRYSIAAWFRR